MRTALLGSVVFHAAAVSAAVGWIGSGRTTPPRAMWLALERPAVSAEAEQVERAPEITPEADAEIDIAPVADTGPDADPEPSFDVAAAPHMPQQQPREREPLENWRDVERMIVHVRPIPTPGAFVASLARATDNLPPEYPEEARRQKQEGTVILELVVDVTGSVRDARVGQSSGFALLDAAALERIRTWRFQPATRDSVPVEDSFRQPVVFKLSQS